MLKPTTKSRDLPHPEMSKGKIHNTEHLTSTAFVEKNAIFLVSNGFSLLKSGVRLCGSDSPVNDELSTCKIQTLIVVTKFSC